MAGEALNVLETVGKHRPVRADAVGVTSENLACGWKYSNGGGDC